MMATMATTINCSNPLSMPLQKPQEDKVQFQAGKKETRAGVRLSEQWAFARANLWDGNASYTHKDKNA